MSSYQVSVIIPSFKSSRTLFRCLRALQQQETSASYEIIVIDSSPDDSAERIAHEFPEIMLIRSGERLYPGGARNLGICHASGDILAFTDADCIADGGWIEAIVQAHQGEAAVIGGTVANANPDNTIGWGYYFTEFNQWSPGAPAGEVGEIPTCCLSMKRAAYDRWGPFRERGYCSDTLFHWRRARDHEFPLLEPAIRVAHINPDGLWHMLEHEAFHGRYFARVRAGYQETTRLRLLLNIATAPLLPFVLFGRALGKTWSRGHYRGEFLKYALLSFGGMAFWSWGEFTGYLSVLISGPNRYH